MRFVLGIIVGVVLLCLGVFCYFWLGFAPTATYAQPWPFEQKIAMHALHARADKEAPKDTAIPVNDANYAAGATVYADNCAVCHGLPNQPRTAIAAGMYPRPPQLFKGTGVTDDPAGETYWKVKNGVRLTGMPAFRDTLSDQQMWQVSILLANADKLPAATHDMLQNAKPTLMPPAASPNAPKQPDKGDEDHDHDHQH